MNTVRYSMICLICALLVLVTGCGKSRVTVVNTSSGVVIHSTDFTQGLKQKVENKYKQVNTPSTKSSGAVIDLGSGYEKIEMGPLFDRI